METNKIHKKLNELASTAISGNDISSSVLYVSALAIAFAGQYAWITLLIVSLVLFLFRKIYGEVVGALPLNGGAYNALLNTTSKGMASFAATLTLLSYMATAVISANEAIHYLHHLIPAMPIIISTIVLLAFFAVLTIGGITESSKVAIGIFIFHLSSLFILASFIFYFLLQNGSSMFIENWNAPVTNGSISNAIFLGFAASMLGVSGFESSANFVEEQQKGVFPKTLRNMWAIVSIINPLMAVLALALFAIPVLQSSEFQNTLLIEMGHYVGGKWVATLIAVDAFLVLSGAVLTSFVGVSGLLERMTLDRIMPQFFLKKSSRGSSYRIILMFFFLSVSVLLITNGDVKLLAGVYTISFLSVMALFGIGNILLKVKRKSLPRPEVASWLSIFIAISAVVIALIGNITMKTEGDAPSNLVVFLDYFIPSIIFVAFMLNRTLILKFLLNAMHTIFDPVRSLVLKMDKKIIKTIDKINSQEFVFFTKGDNIATLNKVMLYIIKNEHTKKIKIVLAHGKDEVIPPNLPMEIEFLGKEYPEITIEFLIIEGQFSPKLIKELSKKWKIPINFMFIGSPSDKFPYKIEELGGVRLII
ncbi:amino acid/polyamine/organocation transporter, APC superfamily [Lutibacter oricola]|uniref:Amino acid/polyamine/organocation transporter, APC superfamily n=1 Tax=Lutibacter oricola TaxID=762486 RepID=A0A1H2REB8_9FLAO|nr:APC family permease [Lutibacter oricola]SDW17645.1 amino acid/polyamine/organocation transporter, APC superfamily [Lutibacter oricola]